MVCLHASPQDLSHLRLVEGGSRKGSPLRFGPLNQERCKPKSHIALISILKIRTPSVKRGFLRALRLARINKSKWQIRQADVSGPYIACAYKDTLVNSRIQYPYTVAHPKCSTSLPPRRRIGAGIVLPCMPSSIYLLERQARRYILPRATLYLPRRNPNAVPLPAYYKRRTKPASATAGPASSLAPSPSPDELLFWYPLDVRTSHHLRAFSLETSNVLHTRNPVYAAPHDANIRLGKLFIEN